MTEKNCHPAPAESAADLQQEENDQRQMRSEHLAALYAADCQPYGQGYERTCSIAEMLAKYQELQPGEERPEELYHLAGRVNSRRGHGKLTFMDLNDRSGHVQLFFKVNTLGEENYKMLDLVDLIDMVTVTGYPFRTQRGELSLHVTEWAVAAKALQPPPAKFHGLKDVEVRYRQRYADLLSNADVRDVFIKRSRIVSSIRRYLDNIGYLEVETPTLSIVAGGAAARPFITFHNALNAPMYLRIATELHLKRCIVGGMEKVYEIGRIFRNEGIDTTHNPEFTTIELYEAWSDLEGMMNITEGIIDNACKEVLGSHIVNLNGTEINLKPPYARRTMDSLLQEYAGISIAELREPGRARAKALELGVKLGDREFTLAHYIDKIFEAACEEHLVQPTFITDYPIELSPLAKQREDDPSMTYRFELFVNCHELANAFSELNDPREQLRRFEAQQAQRDLDDEAHPIDMDFIRALEYGMPPTGGMGMGIDRLVMLLTAQESIRDVLLFPTMKLRDDKGVKANAPVGTVPGAPAAEEVIDFSKVQIEPLFQDCVDFETFSKSDFRAVKVIACEAVPKSKKLLKFTLDDGTGTERTILSGIHPYYEPEDVIGQTLVAITNLPPRAMMGIESCGMLLSAVHKEDDVEKLHLLMVDPHIPAGAKLY